MTAAALPLLTAGTLLSTTDAANATTQNDGMTLNASVSAGLTQDKTHAWDVTKTAEPASLDIWKGGRRQGPLHRQRHQTRRPARGGQPQAGTNHAEVKLSNGTVFGADAAFDFSNAQVKEVDKTATITNHAEIKGGDSGQVSSANGTVQVSKP